MVTDRCLECGESAVAERCVPFTVEHHGASATIEDGQMFCAACTTVSYRGDQVSQHELAVATAIRNMDGLLSPEDLFCIRSRYRLRQTDMERMLSTGPKTWTRWERGKIPQNKATDTLIRVISEDFEIARRLMRQSGVDNPEAEAVFCRIEEDARSLARTMLRSELGARPTKAMEVFADRMADRAFDAAHDIRKQAALRAEAT